MARTKNRCPVPGCLRLRYEKMALCLGHHIAVPIDLRREMVRLDSIGSPRYAEVRREAIRMAAVLEDAEVMNIFDGGTRARQAPERQPGRPSSDGPKTLF